MVMTISTFQKMMGAIGGRVSDTMPGTTIKQANAGEIKYWLSQGWIAKKGEVYVLTQKGWREL